MDQISFWSLNLASESKGSIITTSSNQIIADNLRDNDLTTFWLSLVASDATTETITFEFLEPLQVSMIMLRKLNFKNFQIKYWNGATYVNFSTAINIVGNTETEILFYRDFTPVITSKIRIYADTTIAANSQKQLAEVIITDFIGRFEGYPIIDSSINKKLAVITNYRGKESVFEKGKYREINLKFKTYPNENDILLAEILRNYAEEFYIWLSDGDGTQFLFDVEPFRKQDIYLINEVSSFTPDLNNGVYSLPYSFELKFTEA